MIEVKEEKTVANSVKQRDSNLELFRIITMLFIIAHHYVVNSGLTDLDSILVKNQFSVRSIFYLIFGAWGKTGINCFVMITGYFMCKSKITLMKFLKLFLEIYFYKVVFYCIFLFSGYEPFSLKGFAKFILPFSSLTQNFTGCYLIFFLCIPFLNILVQNMNEKQHRLLCFLLFCVFSVFGTFFTITFNYVTWFCVLYIFASYIRLHPIALFENRRFWLFISIISIFLGCLSVICCTWLGNRIGKFLPFYFLADSNKILAVTTGVSLFMLFKNIKIKYSPFINTVASTCFGVLLIHANSATMRRLLWKDVLKNVQMYDSNIFILHAICSVFGIFIICFFIDLCRIKFIETPLFRFIEKKAEI